MNPAAGEEELLYCLQLYIKRLHNLHLRGLRRQAPSIAFTFLDFVPTMVQPHLTERPPSPEADADDGGEPLQEEWVYERGKSCLLSLPSRTMRRCLVRIPLVVMLVTEVSKSQARLYGSTCLSMSNFRPRRLSTRNGPSTVETWGDAEESVVLHSYEAKPVASLDLTITLTCYGPVACHPYLPSLLAAPPEEPVAPPAPGADSAEYTGAPPRPAIDTPRISSPCTHVNANSPVLHGPRFGVIDAGADMDMDEVCLIGSPMRDLLDGQLLEPPLTADVGPLVGRECSGETKGDMGVLSKELTEPEQPPPLFYYHSKNSQREHAHAIDHDRSRGEVDEHGSPHAVAEYEAISGLGHASVAGADHMHKSFMSSPRRRKVQSASPGKIGSRERSRPPWKDPGSGGYDVVRRSASITPMRRRVGRRLLTLSRSPGR